MKFKNIICVIILLFAGCSQSDTLDQTAHRKIVDLAGYESYIVSDVERIILPRSKDIYSLMAVLGDDLPNKLVAWGPDLKMDDRALYDELIKKYPQLESISVTGSIYTDSVDVEQIINLKPDLVIMDKFMIKNGYKFVDIMKRLKIPMIFLDGSSDPLNGPQEGIRLLGKVLNKKQKAGRIIDYINFQIDSVITVMDYQQKGPSVYIEQGYLGPQTYSDTYSSVNGAVSWGVILNALNVTNIADGVIIGQTPISAEYVLVSDPNYIVITGQGWKNKDSHKLGYDVSSTISHKSLSAYKSRPGWDKLSAVKNNNITSVFHNSSSILTFAALQQLSRTFYPDRLVYVNPEKSLETFFERFMPIPYKGTWVYSLH